MVFCVFSFLLWKDSQRERTLRLFTRLDLYLLPSFFRIHWMAKNDNLHCCFSGAETPFATFEDIVCVVHWYAVFSPELTTTFLVDQILSRSERERNNYLPIFLFLKDKKETKIVILKNPFFEDKTKIIIFKKPALFSNQDQDSFLEKTRFRQTKTKITIFKKVVSFLNQDQDNYLQKSSSFKSRLR